MYNFVDQQAPLNIVQNAPNFTYVHDHSKAGKEFGVQTEDKNYEVYENNNFSSTKDSAVTSTEFEYLSKSTSR